MVVSGGGVGLMGESATGGGGLMVDIGGGGGLKMERGGGGLMVESGSGGLMTNYANA